MDHGRHPSGKYLRQVESNGAKAGSNGAALVTGRRGGARMVDIVAWPFRLYCQEVDVRQGVFGCGASAGLPSSVSVGSVCASAARSCSFSSLSLSLSG